MNWSAMLARNLLLPVLFALAACGGQEPPAGPSRDGVDLRAAQIGGPFALTDKHGKTVRWDDFAGKYRVVYFGYTWCPDICPTDVQRMTQGLRLFAREHPAAAKLVQPIFISVDPARDTPAKVGEFAAAFSPDLVGLTGTPEQIEAAKRAFKVFSANGETQPNGGYLVNHSNLTYLFDPAGKPRGTLPTDKGPEAVAAELAAWLT
jgi:protein SCO1